MAREISGTFAGAGEFSSVAQGSQGVIAGHSGAGSMQLEIQMAGVWVKEGTSITQDQTKHFYLSASLPVRLASEGAISYAMHVR